MFVSYGHNFEDVLLNRAFRDVENGFYVDIGAGDAKHGNVSYGFYERGWSGVNVEPGPKFDTLPVHRPRDINVRTAIGEYDGEISFFFHPEHPSTSTLISELGPQYEDKVRDRVEMRVPVMTMARLVKEHVGDRHVHFLKVDVEGSEAALFRSCDWTKFRPEIIVAEGTKPYTNTPVYHEWADLLTSADYLRAYFDGVNVWFVRKESAHLLPCFAIPVNQNDEFVPYAQVKLKEKLEALRNRGNELRRVRETLTWPEGPRAVRVVLPIAAFLRNASRKLFPSRRGS
jgi:FkbM family methyltransferase